MTDKTEITVEDCLKGAFQALLDGDTKKRDELCALAERAFGDEESLPPETPVPLNPDGEH